MVEVEDVEGVVEEATCLMFHPTMAIAPTVEEASAVLVVTVQAVPTSDPSSVYAHIPRSPLFTVDKQAPTTSPVMPSAR